VTGRRLILFRVDLDYETPEDADLVVDLTKDTVPEIVHGKHMSYSCSTVAHSSIHSHHPPARDPEPRLNEQRSIRKRLPVARDQDPQTQSFV
jgi:hypothetical protein